MLFSFFLTYIIKCDMYSTGTMGRQRNVRSDIKTPGKHEFDVRDVEKRWERRFQKFDAIILRRVKMSSDNLTDGESGYAFFFPSSKARRKSENVYELNAWKCQNDRRIVCMRGERLRTWFGKLIKIKTYKRFIWRKNRLKKSLAFYIV